MVGRAITTALDRAWHRRVIVCAVIVAAGTLALPATAQDAAIDFIEPKISARQFAELCQPLNLDRGQRSVIDLFYSDYAEALQALVEQTDARAREAGRQQVRDALAGKVVLEPAELRRMRLAVLEVYRDAWPVADRLCADLLDSVLVQMTDAQTPRAEAGVRALRREVYLGPRRAGRMNWEYAGDGLDLCLLAEDAGVIDGAAGHAIRSILQEYERALDRMLPAHARAARAIEMERRLARIRKDQAAARAAEHDAVQEWQRLADLNDRTATRIGDVLARQLGEAAQRAWLDRCDQAMFPWLCRETTADRQYRWITESLSDDERRDEASDIYEAFSVARRTLRERAIDIMMRARVEFGRIIHPMMERAQLADPTGQGLYDELVRNSGELSMLERDTGERLEALLGADELKAMRRAMRSRRVRPR